MVDSGYIQLVLETGPTQDSFGNPVQPVTTITEWLKCNLNTITKDYKLLVDGQYQQVKYSIILNKSEYNRIYTFNLNCVKRIRLMNINNDELGEFQIISTEYLRLTGSVKIIV